VPGLLGIEKFVVGKRHSRKKGFVPAEPVSVLCLRDRADVCEFLGLRGGTESDVTRFLRELRDGGMLIADPGRGRLTRRVRIESGGVIRRPQMFVLIASEVERARMAASAFAVPTIPDEVEKRRRPAFRVIAL
jgi:hypothetical protein